MGDKTECLVRSRLLRTKILRKFLKITGESPWLRVCALFERLHEHFAREREKRDRLACEVDVVQEDLLLAAAHEIDTALLVGKAGVLQQAVVVVDRAIEFIEPRLAGGAQL